MRRAPNHHQRQTYRLVIVGDRAGVDRVAHVEEVVAGPSGIKSDIKKALLRDGVCNARRETEERTGAQEAMLSFLFVSFFALFVVSSCSKPQDSAHDHSFFCFFLFS